MPSRWTNRVILRSLSCCPQGCCAGVAAHPQLHCPLITFTFTFPSILFISSSCTSLPGKRGGGLSGGWKPRRERWGDAHIAVPPQRCGGSGCGRPVGAGAGGAPRGPEPPARCSVPPQPPPTAPRGCSQPLGAAPGCPRPRAAAQPERALRRTRPLKTAKENFSRVQIRN